VCCSVLQCVCCSVLQSVAECCRVLQCVAVYCVRGSWMTCWVRESSRTRGDGYAEKSQRVFCCARTQHTATHCNTLQHTRGDDYTQMSQRVICFPRTQFIDTYWVRSRYLDDLVSSFESSCSVWCSVLQLVAVCCSVLRSWSLDDLLSSREFSGALRCSVSPCGAVCCSMLQCVAVWCSGLQCVAVWCSMLQCVVFVIFRWWLVEFVRVKWLCEIVVHWFLLSVLVIVAWHIGFSFNDLLSSWFIDTYWMRS